MVRGAGEALSQSTADRKLQPLAAFCGIRVAHDQRLSGAGLRAILKRVAKHVAEAKRQSSGAREKVDQSIWPAIFDTG
jgi:hypothetical protein